MSSLTVLRLALLSSIACGGVGIAIGFFSKRLPERAWLTGVMLLISVLAFVNIAPSQSSDEKDRVLVMLLFMLVAPCAAIYSGIFFRRTSNRPAAWALLTGGIGMGLLFLFHLVGCIYLFGRTFFDM